MEDIVNWLEDFISEFRQQSGELSQEQKSKISNFDDFFPPCQILLLWFKDANLQYLIRTHDPNRKDGEIEVHAPIRTYETIDRLDLILEDPRWDRELTKEEKESVYDKTITFSRLLEDLFLGMIQQIRGHTFKKPSAATRCTSKHRLSFRSFVWMIEGNIAEMDKTRIVTEIITRAKKVASRKETPPPPPPKPSISSCVTYFYPPIWVGELPKKTFKEKARGSFTFPEKAFNMEYKDRVLVINKDGLIAIGEENIPKATRMLNEIMATFLLLGFEANAVRELEVGEAGIDSSSLTVSYWGTRSFTLRTQLYHLLPGERVLLGDRTEIGKEDLIRVIREAERITEDPDISDFLTFLLQSHTHLKNSEYSQSFIMSWVIIERHAYWLWKKFLKEEQMPRKRRDKLTNPVYWTIDFILEGLNIGGRLSKKDYDDLMFLKNKRNDIIHVGESTTLEEAAKCFEIAKDIVKRRSGLG